MLPTGSIPTAQLTAAPHLLLFGQVPDEFEQLLVMALRLVILAARHDPVEDVVCTVASFADSMVVRSAHSEVAMLRLRVMSLGHFTQYRPRLGVDNNPGAQVHADQSVSSQCHMEVVHDARTWTISSMPRSPGSRGVIARLKSSDSRMTHSVGNSMFDAVEKIT